MLIFCCHSFSCEANGMRCAISRDCDQQPVTVLRFFNIWTQYKHTYVISHDTHARDIAKLVGDHWHNESVLTMIPS